MRLAYVIVFATALSASDAIIHAMLERVQALYLAGNMREAEALVASNEKIWSKNPTAAAIVTGDLGVIQQDTGRLADAERSYKQSLRWIAAIEEDAHVRRTLHVRISGNLASLYLESDQPGKAERILREFEGANLPLGMDSVRLRGSLASLHMVRGRIEEAERLFFETLEYWRSTGRHTDAAVVLNNVATIALGRRDSRKAVELFAQAMEHWKTAGLAHHPLALRTMTNYAFALLKNGQPESAKPMIEEAQQIAAKWFGADSPITGGVLMVHAEVLDATGRKKEARTFRKQASRISSFRPGQHTVDVLDLRPSR